jgi:cellulose synthase/poly-beta-1,6-N-acetylglucosamine synthase-like glycosyltransferase
MKSKVVEPMSPRSTKSKPTVSTDIGSASTVSWASDQSECSNLLYHFHHANIHEKRFAARFARAVPMLTTLVVLTLTLLGAFRYLLLLEVTAAFFNLWMWMWFVRYGLYTLKGIWMTRRAVREPPPHHVLAMASPAGERSTSKPEMATPLTHLIILPNYKEDESIMAETLEALAQAHESSEFRVILAMEDREGPKAVERSHQLHRRFAHCFATMLTSVHPADLQQEHSDGSVVNEIPGKSSNLKWAVNFGCQQCEADGVQRSSIIVTVADADCIFHPSYFTHVGREFAELRAAGGFQHQWTIWQAPQFPFRNYYASPAPSRIWGYIASNFEFGGVTSLGSGGYHMTFSSFSLPLELVMAAKPWDGDVIADDHHCYLKCFLHSIHKQACEQTRLDGKCADIDPPLNVRPVMLPAKSTSVASDTCYEGWKSRFDQAQRHTQGVAELSYVLLGVWDLLCTLPRSAYSYRLCCKLFRVILVPFSINMLPICQTIPFAAMSLYWLAHNRQVPNCPNDIWRQYDNPEFYLCVLAGGWNLVVPMVIPMLLLILASYLMILTIFLQPAEEHIRSGRSSTIWHREDGALPQFAGSRRLALLGMIVVDITMLMPLVMAIYGIIPNIRSYWNVLVRGNAFKFVSAAKGMKAPEAFVNIEQQHIGRAQEKPEDAEIV